VDSLVSTDWLASALGAPDLRVIDASWFLPASGRDARAEFVGAHIPGAVFFDLDDISDPASAFPHMMPDDTRFAGRMGALGLGNGDRIVIYDNSPLHSAARAWWMLRSFGARDVAILDGGLRKWIAEGRPLESGVAAPRRGHFSAALDRAAVADKTAVAALVGDGSEAIVDARSALRFAGAEAEPRAGLASGHIPGSRNLPQGELFEADNRFKDAAGLRSAFDGAGVDLAKPMVTTCGSGVTAAVLLFAAHLLGKDDVRLYDGSWSQWGADPATPKERGTG
jgi:thiosulfate/3-mercaptopyruvate sulfurtransferase